MEKIFHDRDHVRGLNRAIRHIGSQRALARAIGATPQQLNHWLHRDRKIPYEYVIKIEFITEGQITRHDLAPEFKKLNAIIRVIPKHL